jgi:hypothetical protein
MPTEIEATLVIASDDPESVLRKALELRNLGAFRLVPAGNTRIRDTYFDSPEQELKRRGLALRVRQTRDGVWLGLKGPSRASPDGGSERLEIEAKWSPEALQRVAGELRRGNVEILNSLSFQRDVPPAELMVRAGLEVIHDRQTSRTLREVVPSGTEHSAAVAELAIDSVIFRIGPHTVRHFEIEVESRSETEKPPIREVVECLRESLGNDVQPYEYGKLATGKALERLNEDGALGALLNPGGTLKPQAYGAIISVLNVRV